MNNYQIGCVVIMFSTFVFGACTIFSIITSRTELNKNKIESQSQIIQQQQAQ